MTTIPPAPTGLGMSTGGVDCPAGVPVEAGVEVDGAAAVGVDVCAVTVAVRVKVPVEGIGVLVGGTAVAENVFVGIGVTV